MAEFGSEISFKNDDFPLKSKDNMNSMTDRLKHRFESIPDTSDVELSDIPDRHDIEAALKSIQHYRQDVAQNGEILTIFRRRVVQYMNFSLPQWNEWLEDCKRTDNSASHIQEILWKTLEAFPCNVDAWLKYIECAETHEEYSRRLSDGHEMTKNIIPESRKLWSVYWSNQLEHGDSFENQKAAILNMLDIPHKGIDETFSEFSTFISTHDNENYEEHLVEANAIYCESKTILKKLEFYENLIEESPSIDNYALYIDRELSTMRDYDSDRVEALYERALMEYPTEEAIWDDYIAYLFYHTGHGEHYDVTKRARRFCPWSGKIWSFHLSAKIEWSEVMDMPLLDDLLLEYKKNLFGARHFNPLTNLTEYENYVHIAKCWMSISLQIAVTRKNKILMTEVIGLLNECVGICHIWSQSTITKDFQLFLIRCFTTVKRWSEAEAIWESMEKENSFDAEYWCSRIKWLAYEKKASADDIGFAATKALSLTKLDFPEKVTDEWLNSIRFIAWDRWNVAYGQAREAIKKLNRKKRNIEIEEEMRNRKREIARENGNGNLAKKMKSESKKQSESGRSATQDVSMEPIHTESSDTDLGGTVPVLGLNGADSTNTGPPPLTRDREHTSVILSELSTETKEKQIQKFFSDCGPIKSIQSINSNAIVEFENHLDYLAALTKDYKKLNKTNIRVTSAENTIIWTANFPPSYSENELRREFSSFGQILSIRVPSLKFNVKRRFAYIQYDSSISAKKAAETLNNKILMDDDKEYKLVVEISDPIHKQQRTDSQGRELIIKGIDFQVNADEIERYLSKFGKIEYLKIPPSRHDSARSHDGYAFVTYAEKQEADKALTEASKIKLGNHSIQVSLASKRKETVGNDGKSEKSNKNARTITINGLQDTINEAQLRKHLETYGSINHIRVIPLKGTADIEFANVGDAGKAALSLDGSEFAGKMIRVEMGGARTETANKQNISQKNSTIFVPRNIKRKK